MAFKAKMGEFINDVKSITIMPVFTLSPSKSTSDKPAPEGKKDDKVKNKILETWNNFRYEMRFQINLKKNCPLWILGVCHHFKASTLDDSDEEDEEKRSAAFTEDVMADFVSRPWFTYRKNFPPIKGTNITSDTGWGCMLRTAQMMVAQGLMIHYLGREWRWLQKQKQHDRYLHALILGWFIDDPDERCPFSVHQLSDIGRRFGNDPGNWYGPNTVAYIMQEAVERAKFTVPEVREVAIYVAQDCTVYSEDVYDMCGWDKQNMGQDAPCVDATPESAEKPDQFEPQSPSTSTASSESWEDDHYLESDDESSYVIPTITLEEPVPTNKIVGNMIQMSEFTNATSFILEDDLQTRESQKRDDDDQFSSSKHSLNDDCQHNKRSNIPATKSSTLNSSAGNSNKVSHPKPTTLLTDEFLSESRKSRISKSEQCSPTVFEPIDIMHNCSLSERNRPKRQMSKDDLSILHRLNWTLTDDANDVSTVHSDSENRNGAMGTKKEEDNMSVGVTSSEPHNRTLVGDTGSKSPPHPYWKRSRPCSTIILIPVRLGESTLNPIYTSCLQALLSLRFSIGIIGGKPRHSLFFVGYQDESLLHLDPHYCQVSDTLLGYRKNCHNYHPMSIRKTNMKKIDPSCCLGFYCRTQKEFECFKAEAKNCFTATKNQMTYPICLILDGRSQDHHHIPPEPPRKNNETPPTDANPAIKVTKSSNTEFYDVAAPPTIGKEVSIGDMEPGSSRELFKTRSTGAGGVASSQKSSTDKKSKFTQLLTDRFMRQRSSSPVFKRKNRVSLESLEQEFELL